MIVNWTFVNDTQGKQHLYQSQPGFIEYKKKWAS